VLINELTIPASGWGAALPGARVLWLTVEPSAIGHGRTHALLPSSGYAAGTTAVAGVQGANGVAGTNGVVDANASRLAATAGLPTDNLKQFTQMKTRVNVYSDGARGPEPEREEA